MEELKGNIPRAGPKYRLGMYFDTIHNLPSFDEITHHEDTGYTSYWETDTEVDSDFGNFIFNNVAGDSASLICIDDTVDLLALQKRHEEAIASTKPHYKLDQTYTLPTSPSPENPLERSLESKQSFHSHSSKRSHQSGSGSDGMYDRTHPPPVPPPRRATTTTAIDLEDHTYETLDDCKEDYLVHQETIYFSKASDDSHGSQDSTAKPVSNDETDGVHSSSTGKRAEGAGPICGKPRSLSLELPKSPECVTLRQRRKTSESASHNRKRRLEKVASKGSNYPPPMKGFPAGVSEEYAEYLATSVCLPAERRAPMCTSSPPVNQRGLTASPERKINVDRESQNLKSKIASPLVIKHKGKTYLVPVVDNKLQKELEKRSKAENPSVTIKYRTVNPGSFRSTAANGGNHAHTGRSFASPPKMEPCDHAAPHRRRNSSKSSPKASKQVTHYGVL